MTTEETKNAFSGNHCNWTIILFYYHSISCGKTIGTLCSKWILTELRCTIHFRFIWISASSCFHQNLVYKACDNFWRYGYLGLFPCMYKSNLILKLQDLSWKITQKIICRDILLSIVKHVIYSKVWKVKNRCGLTSFRNR